MSNALTTRGGAAAALLAVVALSGCSASGPSDDPSESTEYFLSAMAEGDVQKMCEVYAYRSERYTGPVDPEQWPAAECEDKMWEEYEDYINNPGFADVTVGEATIQGNEAEIGQENLEDWPVESNYGVKLMLFADKWYVIDAD